MSTELAALVRLLALPAQLDRIEQRLVEIGSQQRLARAGTLSPLVDVVAAAEFYGVSVPTMRRMAMRGDVRTVRRGRTVRFDLVSLAPPSEDDVDAAAALARAR